jgi:hypothetical protein
VPRAISPRALLAAVVLSSAGCSGGGGGSTPPPASVEDSLASFGVDTAQTRRADDDLDPLPDGYAPFGAAHTFDRMDELAIVGLPLSPASFGFDSTFVVVEEQAALSGQLSTQALLAPAAATTPWALSRGAAPETLRAVAAGDVDGDGLEELVVLGYAAAGGAWLRVWDDEDAGFVAGAAAPVDLGGPPLTVALSAADFDGDGRADAAVAWTTADGAHVRFVRSGASGFELDGEPVAFPRVAPGAALAVELAAGNLDYDPGSELVVVVNEEFLTGAQETGSARYHVLDDAGAGHARSGTGLVRGLASGTTRTAALAGVATGDVDGDGVDEVVFGGVTGLDPTHACQYAYVLVALDDLKRGLAALGARYVVNALEDAVAPSCGPAAPLRIRTVHVRALDLDADGAAEIQVNQLTYDDFRAAGPWALWRTLPLELLFGARAPGPGGAVTLAGTFDATTSAMATGDFTRDGRGDVAIVSQIAGDPAAVRIWSFGTELGKTGETWHEATAIPLAQDPGEPARPLLVAADAKRDGMTLRFSEGSYRLVFTEPVIIAALAAAPCSAALGQDLSACTTSFGTATSDTVATEDTYTFSVAPVFGVSLGGSVLGVKVETEITASVKKAWEWKTRTAYTLTRRVVYTTGPIEDAVVFTTIPYDVYTYRVLSHPDPAHVGQEVVVALPRSPIHILAERGFYNAHVPEGAPKVDDRVFSHVAGDPRSYKSAARKADLVATHRGLSTERIDVGQGTGSVGAELNVYQETGSATAHSVEATLDIKATLGVVIAGISIGGGGGHELSVSHGSESLYAGSVSNLPAGAFESGRYSFGLFTYVHDDPQRPYEVVDYWVE